MKKTLKWSLVMMLAVFGLTFASCSDDDDDKTPTLPTVEDVNGDYNGRMTYAIVKTAASDEVPGVTLDLTVANDSISFKEFPFGTLVKAIITDEATAEGIIASIGKLEYKTGYTAALNAAKDSVYLTLDPKPLKLEALGMSIAVSIEAASKGSFAIDGNNKNLKFNLTATEAKLGEQNMLPAPIVLSFDMKKK